MPMLYIYGNIKDTQIEGNLEIFKRRNDEPQ